MGLFEGKTPAERNKIIAVCALGVIALFLVGRMFFGSTSSTSTKKGGAKSSQRGGAQTSADNPQQEDEIDTAPRPIPPIELASYAGEPGRNIFAVFARPASPSTTNAGMTDIPTPVPVTPPPPPPLLVASVAPQSVYAQTGEFRLQVSGDKFTPETRIYVNEQEVPTQFVSPQQLAATVQAFHITAPGNRQIVVRTPDRQLYSNSATLNVMQPPMPQYAFIGYIQTRGGQELATLRDQGGKQKTFRINEVIGRDLQLGDRFRVTGISPKVVEVTDTELKIKHTLSYVNDSRAGSMTPMPRPGSIQPPPPSDEPAPDEEP